MPASNLTGKINAHGVINETKSVTNSYVLWSGPLLQGLRPVPNLGLTAMKRKQLILHTIGDRCVKCPLMGGKKRQTEMYL